MVGHSPVPGKLESLKTSKSARYPVETPRFQKGAQRSQVPTDAHNTPGWTGPHSGSDTNAAPSARRSGCAERGKGLDRKSGDFMGIVHWISYGVLNEK